MSQRVNHFNIYFIGEIVNETVTPDEPIETMLNGLLDDEIIDNE